jgi:cytochrome b subunit of formate dehydrogenase
MDSAALDMQAPATRRDRVKRASDLVLSAVFCVVLPIAFWLAMVALVAWAVTGAFLSWQILTLTGGAMALILVPIWASLFRSKNR